VLKKFESDGQPRNDLPLVEWSAKYCLYQVQVALDEILRNFPIKWLGVIVRIAIFPLGLSLRQPNDALGHRVASLLIKPGKARNRLTQGIFLSDDPADITGRLEDALDKIIKAEPIERRLRHDNLLQPGLIDFEAWIKNLQKAKQITAEEAGILLAAQVATRKVIMVDDFSAQELVNKTGAKKKAVSTKKSPTAKKAQTRKQAVTGKKSTEKKTVRGK
jgi:acyl-CoA dehydrogenase